MLRANTDRSVKLETIRSAKKVRRIARTPRKGGSSEATSERKNSSESRKMIGNANSSARARSLPTCVLTCASAIAPPPSSTSSLRENLDPVGRVV
jgi:hypothetical protein